MKPYACFFSLANNQNVIPLSNQDKILYVCVLRCNYGSHGSESLMLIKQ